jgi:hypothetical protein
MLITKEQQEALLEDYIKRKHSQDECIGFIDGMNAVIELILRLELSKVERLKNKC